MAIGILADGKIAYIKAFPLPSLTIMIEQDND